MIGSTQQLGQIPGKIGLTEEQCGFEVHGQGDQAGAVEAGQSDGATAAVAHQLKQANDLVAWNNAICCAISGGSVSHPWSKSAVSAKSSTRT
jgi:hypothetical protein